MAPVAAVLKPVLTQQRPRFKLFPYQVAYWHQRLSDEQIRNLYISGRQCGKPVQILRGRTMDMVILDEAQDFNG